MVIEVNSTLEPARPLTRAVRLASPGCYFPVRLAANVLSFLLIDKQNSRRSRQKLEIVAGEA